MCTLFARDAYGRTQIERQDRTLYILTQYSEEDEKFLIHVITGNETWVSHEVILHCMWLSVTEFFYVTRVLMAKGANLCAADASGSTALHVAAKGGYLDIVQYLSGSFAPIDMRNTKKETALWWQRRRDMRES